MAKIVIDTELNTKQFDKQIEQLTNKLNAQKKSLENIKNAKPYLEQQKDIQNYQIEIEKTTNSLIKLKEQQNKLALSNVKNVGYNLTPSLASGFSLSRQTLTGKAMGDLTGKTEYVADSVKDLKNAFDIAGESGEKAGERSGRGFERGITSLKRFSLALFGIRSAFSLVRRATSTYLSQHEDTANKINAIWVALGNALAPIIEALANMVLKFIGYLNVFLQALGFDVDLTKGMNKSTKAIGGTTKAMKELNNQVASFDEMNVAQKETSSGGASGGGGIGGTNGFEMPELNQDVVKFLKDTAGLLKDNWDWISKILLLIGGIKLVKWLTGLGKIGSALGLIAGIGVVAVGVDLIYDLITGRNLIKDLQDLKDGFERLQKANKQNTQMNKENAKGTKELIAQKKEENKQYQKNSQELQINFDYLRSVVEQEALENKELAEKVDNMSGTQYWYERQTGTIGQYNERLKDNNDTMRAGIQGMVDMYNAGQLNEEQQKKLFEILDAVNGTIEDGIVKYEDMDTHILDASKHTEDYTKVVDASNRELNNTSNNAGPLWRNISDVASREGERMKNSLSGTWGGIKQTAQDNMRAINNMTATPKIKGDFSELQNKLNNLGKIPGVNALFGSFLTNKLANIKLATGGIFYNPGRGVSMTNVLVGEATGGAEGVVPLNNEQSMDLIGQSIARHLVVNLTNTTMLDSKVIAREQRRIEDENNFATNGRGVL